MKAIILAAGCGHRLSPDTDGRPKCLVDIGNGMSILEHQLEAFRLCGVEDVVIVGGHKVDLLHRAVAGYDSGDMTVRIIYNPHYNLYNNLYSLWIASEEMDGPFVVANGDTVFDADILRDLLMYAHADVCLTISRKAQYDSEDMKVQIRNAGIRKVTKIMSAKSADAESIGLIKFQNRGGRLLRDSLNHLVSQAEGVHHFYLKAIQQIIDDGHRVGFVSTNGRFWREPP